MNKLLKSALGAGTVLSMMVAGVTSAAAVDFSGKTIEWTIPFSETGGHLSQKKESSIRLSYLKNRLRRQT